MATMETMPSQVQRFAHGINIYGWKLEDCLGHITIASHCKAGGEIVTADQIDTDEIQTMIQDEEDVKLFETLSVTLRRICDKKWARVGGTANG